ncbi:TPA: hypothetical protein ACK3Q6_001621 [Burkholderia cepacia]|uniref:hypothetical protein n=1 Tax=Burkholderia cepacia TaxID=292 RepID=UPI001CF30682|nr:hypothetical protein [Burkholderia cepacia]MCA8363192.1 hypothetical protein [Burkholderia cepacia]HDR9756500.1 hypothetical protein [Burkholderia cepacia ATCC 25416]HDV6364667.1 hypothetical protein [Burkholderia cepacia]
MKATILATGALKVSPETGLEAYALAQWSRVNFGDWYDVQKFAANVIVDLSGYPEALAPTRTTPQPQPGRRAQP